MGKMHLSEELNELSQTEHLPCNQHPDQETEWRQPCRAPPSSSSH